MSWFTNIFQARTKDWFFSVIPKEQTPNKIEYKTLIPHEEYLNIILKSMRIVNVRKGLSKFYATVHSHIEVQHISGKPASFNYVTTPGNLDKLDSANVDRVININRRLLGPVPYRGGDVKLEIGLFSIKEADLAEPFIELLTNMSSLGGVSFIATALPYVKPLEDGIKLLTGSSADTILEIGYNTELTSVETGYFVVMRVDKDIIDVADLLIDPRDYKLVDKSGKAVKDYPYMVFEISSTASRNDWFNIQDISTKYNDLQLEVQRGDYNKAKEALSVFKRAVLTSPDLISKDAQTLYVKVETEVNTILAAIQTANLVEPKLQNLINYTLSDIAPNTIIEAFYQKGKNNCATIALIKLAIATYQMDNVFSSVSKSPLDGSYSITLRNNEIITISADDLFRLSKNSGFTLNPEADRSISERILEFANLCFAVIIKYNMTVDKLTEEESLYEINVKGINSDYAYLNLGFSKEQVEFLTFDNNGIKDPMDYATHKSYMLYNKNHCVMSALDKFDEYGSLTSVQDFVRLHSSFFNPGKTCWAYLLK
ncbi:MAG: hypothetical protein PSV16_11580 [Flavobacterium sp.]|nr:hypothetical protein [Flavobacterium sp.]